MGIAKLENGHWRHWRQGIQEVGSASNATSRESPAKGFGVSMSMCSERCSMMLNRKQSYFEDQTLCNRDRN